MNIKVLIGDFNLVLDVEMDRKNTYCNNNKAMEEVKNLMDQYNLYDIWRLRYGEKREYSWTKVGNRGEDRKASQIDLALVSAGLDQSVKNVLYVSSIQTDHRAIYIVIELTQNDRGKGFWKMNASLLNEVACIRCINEEIDRSLEICRDKNPLAKWEMLKQRVKKSIIKYSREKASVDREVIANLSEKVNEYESEFPLNQQED